MTNETKAMLYDYLTEQIFYWSEEDYSEYVRSLWTAGFHEDMILEDLVDNIGMNKRNARILVDRALNHDKHEDELEVAFNWDGNEMVFVWDDKAGTFTKKED